MICYSLLVVCALQGVTWARTVGLEGVGEVKTGMAHDKGLLLGVDKYKGSLVPGGSVEKGGLVKIKSISELLVEGVREVLRANYTGDIDAGIEQKSLIATAKEFATELQEWIKDGEEGRHFKRHKMMARMALWLKTLLLGVVLPGAVAVALFAAWKGITLSLMALLLAGIIGIKGLVASASKGATVGPQHVVVSGLPTHHHHQWRRDHPLESTGWTDAAHHLAYRAHSP